LWISIRNITSPVKTNLESQFWQIKKKLRWNFWLFGRKIFQPSKSYPENFTNIRRGSKFVSSTRRHDTQHNGIHPNDAHHMACLWHCLNDTSITKSHYAECFVFVMMNVVMLNVVMLSVVAPLTITSHHTQSKKVCKT